MTRLRHVAPDQWALKGGLALLARVGLAVRGTKDADANWRASRQTLEDVLSEIENLEPTDWFTFQFGDPRPLLGEGEQGALRYPAIVTLDGRVFEELSLDVNLVGADDSRPIEQVETRSNPFEFIGEPRLVIPMITPAQQLAEKLHAYTRLYDEEASSRAKDLYDMLVIADQVHLPYGDVLTEAAKQTFKVRATQWPPQLNEPPADWAKPWQGFVTDYPLRWADLDMAFTALQQFWQPILTGTAVTTRWRSDHWQWT